MVDDEEAIKAFKPTLVVVQTRHNIQLGDRLPLTVKGGEKVYRRGGAKLYH